MTKLLHSLYFLIALMLISCGGSNALTKKAVQLEDAGLVTEAAEFYYDALSKKRTNIDAQIGLKKTGQVLLSKKLAEFSQAQAFDSKKEAVYKYLEAESYQKKVARVGVNLEIPAMYRTDFEISKERYLGELYEKGSTLMDEQQFSAAESIFSELSLLDPEFKDAANLQNIAFVEPKYKAGKNALKKGNYRTALARFTEVTSKIANYKDTELEMQNALELGQYSLAMLTFENSSNKKGIESLAEAYVLEALADINDPFLRIVDRENLQMIMDEQTLGMSGVLDEETVVSAGEIIGAQAIVTGTIISYTTSNGRVVKKQKTGYEHSQVKHYTKGSDLPQYIDKYKEIDYQETSAVNKASLSFQYKVISLKTGEVLLTNLITKEHVDNMAYVNYEGELKSLFPAGANGQVNTKRSSQMQLHKLVNASREIKSTDQLTNEIMLQSSLEMKSAITKLLKTQIK